jgi:alkylation response protein AidB-like acyl-CoA dehydrogenase
MPLVLTEEQTMLRDSARAFMSESAPIAQLRQLRDTDNPDGFSRDLWARFAEMGYTGVLVPEAHGGLGLGPVEAGLVMEEIGRNLSASPFLASGVVAATALMQAGNPAQQTEWLPAIASGQRIVAFAIDERAKHNPAHIELAARQSGNGWQLDGNKCFVVDGHAADAFIVAARTQPTAGNAQEGLSLFIVPAKSAGLAVERVSMADARPTARLTFKQVTLPADALIGQPHGAGPVIEAALDAGRVAAAAELLGLAETIFERTLNYLKERKQFDRIIGEFQALQHRAATLYTDLAITRAAVINAQQTLAAGGPKAAAAASIAKSRAGSTATLAVQEGVQMHGGMGMTDEFDAGFYMRRARVLQELWGDADFHADRLARLRGY